MTTELDIDFYRATYADLAHLSDKELREHWKNHGIGEGRQGQALQLFDREAHPEFDPVFYRTFYPDLAAAGLSSDTDAWNHFNDYGRDEERFGSLGDWATTARGQVIIDTSLIDVEYILAENQSLSVHAHEITELCVGNIYKPIKLFADSSTNAEFYTTVGRKLLGQRKGERARACFETSLMFEHNVDALVGIGQSCLIEPKRKRRKEALAYFEAAALLDRGSSDNAVDYVVETYLDTESPQIVDAILTCYLDIDQPAAALDLAERLLEEDLSNTWIYYKLDRIAKDYFRQVESTLSIQAAHDDRDELIETANAYAERIYGAYFNFLTTYENPDDSKRTYPGTTKVLIIGEFSVPQCERYRINQKTEQLRARGVEVKLVDWSELDGDLSMVSLHDTVIFYRVQASPLVLKAMAIANAGGKKTFYEIDDLLFDKVYPPPIDSYGGTVSPSFYNRLTASMALMQAAARRCPFGIASTAPLAALLREHVTAKRCLVHRNGLDSQSQFGEPDKSNKEHVDIIYASGTLAHNEDFFEQTYEPLKDVLRSHPHVRLVIAGYLELSTSFLQEFGDQVVRLPFVANVQAYWEFLKSADINLAILNDDLINGAKSELKWVEAACFAIPSVVSATENYRDIIDDGVDAFMVSTPDEWRDALEALIVDAELRTTIGKAAKDRIAHQYSLHALGERLLSDMNKLAPRTALEAKKKKVALVNVYFPPQSIGGATRVIADNFDELPDHYGDDYEMVVFTSDAHCTDPHLLHTYRYKGVKVYRSTIDFRENMDWEPSDTEMYKMFARFLEIEKPDLVHFHCVQRLSASIVHAAKNAGIPYVVTIHDAWWISDFQFLTDKDGTVYPVGHPDPYAPRALRDGVSLTRSLHRLQYLRTLLDGADQLLTVSEAFAKIYQLNGFPNVAVNKNGTSSTVEWKPKDTADKERVVCGHVGNAARHKGFHLLRDAVLETQPENLEFLVVDYGLAPGTKRAAMWGNVPVTYIGPVPQAEIVSLYQQIDVLFAPSLWPESFGLVTREAAACQCWVVASDMGAMGEDVEEGVTGFRVAPELGAMVDVIGKIDSNPERFKSLSPVTSQRSSDDQAKELVGIWNQTLTSS